MTMGPKASVTLFSICCIVLVGAGCYWNTFHAPFYLDDHVSIVQNTALRQPGAVPLVWQRSHTRFIGYLSLAINYWIGGTDVAGYHAVNLAIHLAAALAVYWLALLVFSSPPVRGDGPGCDQRGPALLAGLVFVCHPVQTQAVTYIIQRFASLAALWYVLAVCGYLKWRFAQASGATARAWGGWAAGTVLMCLLAFFTKESAFSLPLMLIMVELSLVRKGGRIDWPYPAAMVAASALLGLAAVWLKLPLRETDTISRTSYLFTQFRVTLTYLRLLVFPVGQNLDYDYPVYHHLRQLPVMAGLGAIVALSALAVLLFKRRRAMSFGICWFFIGLLVESSVIPIRDVIFEHRLYLPLAGFALFAADGLSGLFRGQRERSRAIVLAAVIAVLGGSTLMRNRVWNDPLRLWSDVVAKSPRKARPHDERGLALAQTGDLDGAMTEYRDAVRLDPGYSEAWYNIGVTFARSGGADSALRAYDHALAADPRMVMALNNRGAILLLRGSLPDAERDFRSSIDLNPGQSLPYYNLGRIAFLRGDLRVADSLFITAVSRDSLNYWAWFGQGAVALARGNPRRSIDRLTRASDLAPLLGQSYYLRGTAQLQLGERAGAAMDLSRSRALGYRPDRTIDWFLRPGPGNDKP